MNKSFETFHSRDMMIYLYIFDTCLLHMQLALARHVGFRLFLNVLIMGTNTEAVRPCNSWTRSCGQHRCTACSLQPRGSPDRGGCSVIVRALLTFAGSEIEPKRQDANARRPEERAFRTLPRRRGLRRLAICHSC